MTDVKHINAYISFDILIFDRNSGRDIYNTYDTIFKENHRLINNLQLYM